jgi:hypothetical protein
MAEEYGNQSKSYESRILRSSINSFKACGYEKITVDNTVKRLTVPTGAKYALLKLESSATGNSVFYLEYYRPVSATDGIPIADGTAFDITDAQNLAGFNVIQSTAGTHTLYVQYYK